MKDEIKQEGEKISIIVAAAVILSATWFFLLYYFVSVSPVCTDKSVGFIESWFSCRTTNEIGDFFAGAFAPLAFLWLVATVLIQSSGLRAQKRELHFTRIEHQRMREEAIEARKVMQAQLKETEKNVELIEAQLQIQQAQHRQVEQDFVDRLISEMVTELSDFITERIDNKKVFAEDKGILLCSPRTGGDVYAVLTQQLSAISECFVGSSEQNRLLAPEKWNEVYIQVSRIVKYYNESSIKIKSKIKINQLKSIEVLIKSRIY